ncbi:MAG TPA: hypothetical protein VLB90_06535, partial [Pseudomonadales bacterium]|nr:hypothetical protein [Pseudomonadales bacterium]
SNNAANGNQQNIYTETSLDKDKVFVQQQVIVTWRLISRFPISQPQFFPPQIDGVLVQDLGIRAYKRSDAERVVEQSYALFPQKSGNIIIPPQQFQVIVDAPQRNSAGFFRPSRSQMQLSTDEKSITVVPAESSTNNPQNTHWLPASSLEISQEILGADSAHPATAGTAFTRIIRMRAEGLSAEQLPPPNMQAPGIKVYNETPVLNNKDNQQGVVGMREDRAAVIAAQPGKLLLPAITIPWYDVDAVQWRETVLPATEIDVLPGTTINSSTSTNTADTKTSAPTQDKLAQINPTQDHPAATPVVNQTPSTTNESYLWQISTAVLFTLLLAIIIYLYKQQHRGKQPISDRTTIVDTPVRPSHNTALRHATEQGDLKKIHQTLQAWAKEQEVNRLALQHPSVTPLLQALEKHLYGNGIAPDAQTLKNLPSQLEELAAGQPPQNNQTSQLETLYR